MDARRVGSQTVAFRKAPVIISTASIAGPKEAKGPLGTDYDLLMGDSLAGERTWERAEARMMLDVSNLCLEKAHVKPEGVHFFLAGDLLNQIVTANFVARELSIPYVGLYGACSTAVEGMAVGAMLIDGGFAEKVLVATSSHHDTAERQYRYPTEFGTQRCPTSQWTVTGAGAILLAHEGYGPRITLATIGRVVDMGLKDVNDMGTAMAPAAADTVKAHLRDTGLNPADYDLIATGDLGYIGKAIAEELLKREAIDVSGRFEDCGLMIYPKDEDIHAGASGCACSAMVLSAKFVRYLMDGVYRRLLLVATGSLHSPTSYQQGESIPCVAHAVTIEAPAAGIRGGQNP